MLISLRVWRCPLIPSNLPILSLNLNRPYGSDVHDKAGKGDLSDSSEVSPEDAFKRAAEIVEKAITRPTLPKFFPELAALSVTRRPVFPGFYKTLSLKDSNLINSLQERLSKGKVYLGLFLRRSSSEFDPNPPTTFKTADEVNEVGVVSQLINIIPSGRDAAIAVLYPHRRIRLERIISRPPEEDNGVVVEGGVERNESSKATNGTLDSALTVLEELPNEHPLPPPYPMVQAHTLLDEPIDVKGRIFKALSQEIFVVLADIAKLNPFFREHITHHNVSSAVFDDPSKLADFIAVLCSGESDELQAVLSDTDIESRMRKALTLLKKELQTAQLQHTISRDIEQKIGQKQKEFFLYEQLKAIKKELGLEGDAKEKLLSQYRKVREGLVLPEAASEVFNEEMSRLGTLDVASAEFSMCRNYLDWLTQLPWGKMSEDVLDVVKARQILDDTHSGMDDVKDRIVEFVAVSRLKGNATAQGKILCFVGPPGVGKTSIGKAIAEALNRKFFRFSVGGLSDVAEIKGHRRTYVGAMPGKLLQALKRVQTSNPVILIDEVDKIGRGGIHGDPTSALLEVLDPEQNSIFSDHYLDTPFDLSKVLFICTANVLETIPAPLLDRMEVITLSGYTSEEKMDIALRFLIPRLLLDNGISPERVAIDPETIKAILRGYCREAGVRSLKTTLDKLLRKLAVQIISEHADQTKKHIIHPSELGNLLGPIVFRNERIHTEHVLTPGLSTGLAWTASGGSILYIETIAEHVQNNTTFKYTGQLGKVMEESCQIAFSFAKRYLHERFPENPFFSKNSIHLHVPEGAVPKDGPSAGCAMTLSLLSAALSKGIPSFLALTGELTLTGKVLPVGGIREKVAAAKRASINTIIIPRANEADWKKLPDYIKEGITVHLVDEFKEIADVCGFSN